MRKKALPIAIGIVTISSILTLSGLPIVQSAGLIDVSNTMSRLAIDEFADHEILFTTPSGVSSTENIVITLPTDFDGTTHPNGSLDATSVELLVNTTPNGICDGTPQTLVDLGAAINEWSTSFSGTNNTTLTLTSGGTSATIAAGAELCIRIGQNTSSGTTASQYQNPSTAGEYNISLTTGSGTDTGQLVVAIIGDDQVMITANIAQTLFFDLSDNSVGFGTLTELASRYATGNAQGSSTEVEAHTISAGTNASNGYTITVSGNTLTCDACDGGNGTTIAAIGNTNTAPNPGTEQFGLRITATGGLGSVLTPYDGSGFAYDESTQPTAIATATEPTPTTTYSTRYLANIDSLTDAGDYETILTYIATGNF